jgi:hypothetical protein
LLDLLYAGRLMEAEGLERHLIIALSQSEKFEHKVAHIMLSEVHETASKKISVIETALQYLVYTSSAD